MSGVGTEKSSTKTGCSRSDSNIDHVVQSCTRITADSNSDHGDALDLTAPPGWAPIDPIVAPVPTLALVSSRRWLQVQPAHVDAARARCHTLCMSERINARISPQLARKVEYLRQRTGKTATEVLSASIETYFAQVAGQAHPRQLLEDFVGCAQGDTELSTNYKRDLAASLGKKLRP
jgi:hypothetical protein